MIVTIRISKENPSLVFSGDREIPTRLSTVPVGNEASPSFPTGTVDPRVGISWFHSTAMIDSMSHISNKNILLYIWRDTGLPLATYCKVRHTRSDIR